MSELTKDELLSKGNELIDQISDAMRMIENTDGARERVVNPKAMVRLAIPIEGADMTDEYDFSACLSDDAIDRIKATILTEIDLAQDKACVFLRRMGLRTPAVVNDKFEKMFDVEEERAADPSIPEPVSNPSEDKGQKTGTERSEAVETPVLKRGGTPPSRLLPQNKIDEIKKAYEADPNIKHVSESLGISAPTVRKYVRQ